MQHSRETPAAAASVSPEKAPNVARPSPEARRQGQGNPDGGRGNGRPLRQPAGEGVLDRNAEEALQLQEAATRVGYGGAALPLWAEFLQRYYCYEVGFAVPFVFGSRNCPQSI